MKKLLFVMTNLRTGGITSSLISLLDIIYEDKQLDIDVLLFDSALKDKLPSGVNVLPENKFLKLIAAPQEEINKISRLLGLVRLFVGFIAKFAGHNYAYKFLFLFCKKLKGYDYAISCTQSAHIHSLYGGCNEFVLDKVNSQNKITFLHCDYKNYKINTPYSAKIYSCFNKIAAVSEGVKNTFLKEVPSLRDKVVVVHNCHNFEKIEKLAAIDTKKYDSDKLNFLTVARIAEEKGHIRLLKVFARLKSEGFDFNWHIVGGAASSTEAYFKNLIKEYNLDRNVFMYHDTLNPYRYFPYADALVVPSFHEAAPIVFSEAEKLKLPIITTKTTSSYELVENKGIGYECQNSEDGLYNMLKRVLIDKIFLTKVKNTLENSRISNEAALEEFYNLIDMEEK